MVYGGPINPRRLAVYAAVLSGLGWLSGCGTTRWTDTARTATEQMLISDAVDRAISRIDFSVLNGRDVYLDATFMAKTIDENYVVSTLRQHMLASGCTLKEKRDQAEFIVEARSAAVGTDRHDVLYGIPAINLVGISAMPGMPSQLPEIAFARRTDQQGIAKIAVFAYHRDTGKPVWQSGADAMASKARDLWVLGAGPFQQGTIYEGTQFAGGELNVPLVDNKDDDQQLRVAREGLFNDPQQFCKEDSEPADQLAEKDGSGAQPTLAAESETTTQKSASAAAPPLTEGPLWEPSIELTDGPQNDSPLQASETHGPESGPVLR